MKDGGVILVFVIFFIIILVTFHKTEHFDDTGSNIKSSEWFVKQPYDATEWTVKTYYDATQPSCLPYSKAARYSSLEDINFLASAYRFWRY